MNARQIKKRLKRQLYKLQSDNNLMHEIIADSPKMQELYDIYTMPSNIIHTTLPFQEFKAKQMVPEYMATDTEELIEYTKQSVAKDIFEAIKENITYEINVEHGLTSITGSIFIGRKRGSK